MGLELRFAVKSTSCRKYTEALTPLDGRMRGELLGDQLARAGVLRHAPVERRVRKRDVALLVEEDDGPHSAPVRVIDVVERLPIPLVRVAALCQRSELADHDRLLQFQQRR